MLKFIKLAGLLTLTAGIIMTGFVLMDRETLRHDLIRLHVVAESDSQQDQAVKLAVRDGVLKALETKLEGLENVQQVGTVISDSLAEIRAVANNVLEEWGTAQRAVVSFEEEAFPVRVYDSFTLPSGVYKSLRITIGSGEGKNWWCVVFPQMCLQATADGVKEVAAGAGFSQGLADTVTGKPGYEIRFYLLDKIGKIESLFKNLNR